MSSIDGLAEPVLVTGGAGFIGRPSKVYGPASGQWLHEVARNLLAGRPVLIDGGNFNPALVYVENLAEILILAAARGASSSS
jgi:nucleoside-diphosphate-sugar epimerase